MRSISSARRLSNAATRKPAKDAASVVTLEKPLQCQYVQNQKIAAKAPSTPGKSHDPLYSLGVLGVLADY
jgi:hypothetical protein